MLSFHTLWHSTRNHSVWSNTPSAQNNKQGVSLVVPATTEVVTNVCVAPRVRAQSLAPLAPGAGSGPPALSVDEARNLSVLQLLRLWTGEGRTYVHNPTYTVLKPQTSEKLFWGCFS